MLALLLWRLRSGVLADGGRDRKVVEMSPVSIPMKSARISLDAVWQVCRGGGTNGGTR